jgi:hypothetical protein
MDTYLDGLPQGGSGKTLLVNAIGKVRNLSIIDGKFWDQKEWFSFSSVDLDSEVLLFDDVAARFDFEKIFPLMTTGLQVRRKHRDHIYIPFEKSPKLAITTNYSIQGDSSSHRRRMHEFEITATYSANYTPRDKFGHNFFEGWSAQDWNLFFNVMVLCMQVFLKNGLIQSEPVNLRLTKLVNRTCEEFIDWANTGIQIEIKHDKRSLYDRFIRAYPEYKSRLKQRDYTCWLRFWGEYNGYEIQESHSDDQRFIKFMSKHPADDIASSPDEISNDKS